MADAQPGVSGRPTRERLVRSPFVSLAAITALMVFVHVAGAAQPAQHVVDAGRLRDRDTSVPPLPEAPCFCGRTFKPALIVSLPSLDPTLVDPDDSEHEWTDDEIVNGELP